MNLLNPYLIWQVQHDLTQSNAIVVDYISSWTYHVQSLCISYMFVYLPEESLCMRTQFQASQRRLVCIVTQLDNIYNEYRGLINKLCQRESETASHGWPKATAASSSSSCAPRSLAKICGQNWLQLSEILLVKMRCRLLLLLLSRGHSWMHSYG